MKVTIGDRDVGDGAPCYVIAEAGVNHNGDIDRAFELVDAAVAVGADAVKFQSFHADRLASPLAGKAAYQETGDKPQESQHEMLAGLRLDATAHQQLADHCSGRGIPFLSTPFDLESVELLEALDVPALKISSGDINNLQLLRRASLSGKPVILSTGMSRVDEIRRAVTTVRESAGGSEAILLHCVSQYPAPAEEANLRVIPALREELGCVVGLSDHSRSNVVAVGAVALGAAIVEKHLTLDNDLAGPDHRASLNPEDFREFVDSIRTTEAALGDGEKRVMPSEENTLLVVRRSLFAATSIPAGTRVEESMIVCLRPGDGIPASEIDAVVGRRAATDLRPGEKLAWENLE